MVDSGHPNAGPERKAAVGSREDILIENLAVGRGSTHEFFRVVAGLPLFLGEPPLPNMLCTDTADQKQAEEQEPSSPPPSAQSDQRYALVYQVAAFQAENKAVSMQRKLRAAQMDSFLAEIQREGTTWHRVLVPFTGTKQQAQDFQARLAEAGVNNPFVYKKKTLQD